MLHPHSGGNSHGSSSRNKQRYIVEIFPLPEVPPSSFFAGRVWVRVATEDELSVPDDRSKKNKTVSLMIVVFELKVLRKSDPTCDVKVEDAAMGSFAV